MITPTRLSDRAKEVEAQSVLIWGGAGTGKTAFIGTAGNRSLFINNGMGAETLRSKWFREKYKVDPMVIDIPFDSAKDGKSFKLLMEAFDYGLAQPDIDTICLDDGTAFRMSSMIRAMEYNMIESKSKTYPSAQRFDLVVPVIQDYGTEMEHTRQFLARVIEDCKAAKKNFVMGAHVRRTFKAAKKIGDPAEHLGDFPAFTGADKNPDMIAGLFDWVFHMRVKTGGKENQYSALTEEKVMVDDQEVPIAKTRHKGVVPVTWVDPNFQELLKKLQESMG